MDNTGNKSWVYDYDNTCPKCGKPIVYVGDPMPLDTPDYAQPFCTCKKEPSNFNSFQYGWICPKCGRVNAPWINSCECFRYSTFGRTTSG